MRSSRRVRRRNGAIHDDHHPPARETGIAHRQAGLRLGREPQFRHCLIEPLGCAVTSAVKAAEFPCPVAKRPERRHGTDDRLQVWPHGLLARVLEQARGPDEQDDDLRELLGGPGRRRAVGIDQHLGERGEFRHGLGMPGMWQDEPGPDEACKRT